VSRHQHDEPAPAGSTGGLKKIASGLSVAGLACHDPAAAWPRKTQQTYTLIRL
jgi:hypothetical protein